MIIFTGHYQNENTIFIDKTQTGTYKFGDEIKLLTYEDKNIFIDSSIKDNIVRLNERKELLHYINKETKEKISTFSYML